MFLQEHCIDTENVNWSSLDPNIVLGIEADAYWCLTKLLDGIQDNYTESQPGIVRQVGLLKELVGRINSFFIINLCRCFTFSFSKTWNRIYSICF